MKNDKTLSKNFICINCPLGCALAVTRGKNDELSVTGNTCSRGEIYGKSEFFHPVRMVTSLVSLPSGCVAPVKTTSPVPLSNVGDVLSAIKTAQLDGAQGTAGEIIIYNVLGLGADIIITKTV